MLKSGTYSGDNFGNENLGNNNYSGDNRNFGNFQSQSGYTRSYFNPPRFRNKRKCSQCENSGNPRCNHCFKCGSASHRIAACNIAKEKNGI